LDPFRGGSAFMIGWGAEQTSFRAIWRCAAEGAPDQADSLAVLQLLRGGSVHPNRVMTGSAERRDDAFDTVFIRKETSF
jgi:hypothetical protein